MTVGSTSKKLSLIGGLDPYTVYAEVIIRDVETSLDDIFRLQTLFVHGGKPLQQHEVDSCSVFSP